MLFGRKSVLLGVASIVAGFLVTYALIGRMAGQHPTGSEIIGPESVAIGPGSMAYRSSGEYLRHGLPVDAPVVDVGFKGSLHIMKYQVSVADYARCVEADACAPAGFYRATDSRIPVTGVNFQDAQNYASWLSQRTGQVWRLPSDEEWAYAAGSRFTDDALGIGGDAKDPSERWIAEYQRGAALETRSDSEPKAFGFYGENEHGVSDLAGNVWEWTSSCYVRAKITDTGSFEEEKTTNCGVRVAEGRHRAYMVFFIRDARGGGCSVGTPPQNLGIRLVREDKRERDLPL